MDDAGDEAVVTGRCYCGGIAIRATEAPRAVAYCHCADCRRVTGGPVAAFAAFDEAALSLTPDEGRAVSVSPGVRRSFCGACGSPLTGRYDYLPGTVYVPVGLLDQAERFAPTLHAHEARRLPWLHIEDGLERFSGSARSSLPGDAAG